MKPHNFVLNNQDKKIVQNVVTTVRNTPPNKLERRAKVLRGKAGSILNHPFKGVVSGEYDQELSGIPVKNQIVIGALRETESYPFKDTVSMTPGSGVFEFNEPEVVTLSASSYVYYNYQYSADTPEEELATLYSSEEWPPAEITSGSIVQVVGYAKWSEETSGGITSWGQEMFECPTISIPAQAVSVSSEFIDVITDVRLSGGLVLQKFVQEIEVLSSLSGEWITLSGWETTACSGV